MSNNLHRGTGRLSTTLPALFPAEVSLKPEYIPIYVIAHGSPELPETTIPKLLSGTGRFTFLCQKRKEEEKRRREIQKVKIPEPEGADQLEMMEQSAGGSVGSPARSGCEFPMFCRRGIRERPKEAH